MRANSSEVDSNLNRFKLGVVRAGGSVYSECFVVTRSTVRLGPSWCDRVLLRTSHHILLFRIRFLFHGKLLNNNRICARLLEGRMFRVPGSVGFCDIWFPFCILFLFYVFSFWLCGRAGAKCGLQIKTLCSPTLAPPKVIAH